MNVKNLKLTVSKLFSERISWFFRLVSRNCGSPEFGVQKGRRVIELGNVNIGPAADIGA